LELGNVEEAAKLKEIMENKQRSRKKARQAQKIDHKPMWFDKINNKEREDVK